MCLYTCENIYAAIKIMFIYDVEITYIYIYEMTCMNTRGTHLHIILKSHIHNNDIVCIDYLIYVYMALNSHV